MTELTKSNGVHPAIHDHFSRMSDVLHERDKLQELSTELQNKLIIAEGLNAEYKETIKSLTQERDYYYRKAYAFTHTLRSMKDTVENMFALVDHEAENSTLTPPAPLPQLPPAPQIERQSFDQSSTPNE